MSDSYYMGAYWSNRRESSDECAERLIQFFVSLADIDEAFTRWFRLGRSRAEALSREVPLQKDLIRKLVERGGTRRYDDHSVIEGLGFGIGLWNGGPDEEAVGLVAHCGSFASTASTWIPNSCVINLPRYGMVAERLTDVQRATSLVQSAVKAFDPDWAVLNSREYRESRPMPAPGVPLVGWITYLSSKFGPTPRLPPLARIAKIDEKGTLIVAAEERFSVENPRHVLIADEIVEALDRAGTLRRID